MIMMIIRWSLLVLLGSLLATQVAASTNQQGWQAFEIRNGHIALPVTVNGVDGWAMLDTGATGLSVNEELYNNQQLMQTRQYTRGAFSIKRDRAARRAEVDILGYTQVFRDIHAASLGDFLLLIGRDFFADYLLQLDYPNQRMRMLERAAIPESEFGNIPARRGRFGVMVQLEVPDTDNTFWVDLDTGNNDGIVTSRSAAARNGLLTTSATHRTQGQDINGRQVTLDRYNIPALKVGPYALENATMYIEAEGERVLLGRRTNRSIGLVVFRPGVNKRR